MRRVNEAEAFRVAVASQIWDRWTWRSQHQHPWIGGCRWWDCWGDYSGNVRWWSDGKWWEFVHLQWIGANSREYSIRWLHWYAVCNLSCVLMKNKGEKGFAAFSCCTCLHCSPISAILGPWLAATPMQHHTLCWGNCGKQRDQLTGKTDCRETWLELVAACCSHHDLAKWPTTCTRWYCLLPDLVCSDKMWKKCERYYASRVGASSRCGNWERNAAHSGALNAIDSCFWRKGMAAKIKWEAYESTGYRLDI